VLVTTGSVLALNKLTSDGTSTAYAITLLIKSVLTVWMFLIIYFERRRSRKRAIIPEPSPRTSGWFNRTTSGYNLIVLLGIVVFGLSDLLKVLFEIGLK
ncbi:MAG: hypothetical protein QGF12_02250, partial [SAR202 cluster bacterium]|nr:hypothetical protein [SAR202 cluster bacterium]